MNRIHYYGNEVISNGEIYVSMITWKWFTVEIISIESMQLMNNTNGNVVMDIAYTKANNNYDYHSILLMSGTWIEYNGIRYNEGDMYRLQRVLEQEKIEGLLEKL